jgi:hypothetical protein
MHTAILHRVDGPQAAGTGDGVRVIVDGVSVSIGREARVTEAGDTRFFAGWRTGSYRSDTLRPATTRHAKDLDQPDQQYVSKNDEKRREDHGTGGRALDAFCAPSACIP